MADTYHTIASAAEAVFKEKMSKFLAFARHVESAAEAKAVVAEMQKKYFDARHVCWAYMLGADRSQFMSNDNGEPSGTAGKPILGQINSLELTDVIVVVVRYFGGIKLGTSGLIAAYRQAARLALEEAGRLECHAMETVEFSFPYIAMNGVMKAVKVSGAQITSQTFDNLCSMTLSIRADDAGRLHSILADVEGLCFS